MDWMLVNLEKRRILIGINLPDEHDVIPTKEGYKRVRPRFRLGYRYSRRSGSGRNLRRSSLYQSLHQNY